MNKICFTIYKKNVQHKYIVRTLLNVLSVCVCVRACLHAWVLYVRACAFQTI